MRAIPFIFFGLLFLGVAYAVYASRGKQKRLRRVHYNAMEKTRNDALAALAEVQDIARLTLLMGVDPTSSVALHDIVDRIRLANTDINKEIAQ